MASHMLLISYTGIILVSLLCVFLFIKKEKRINDWMLLGVLLCFLANLFVPVLYVRQDGGLFSFLLELTNAFMLTLGPLLWLYTRSLMESSFQLGRKELLHFIPALIFLVVLVSSLVGSFDLTKVRIIITAIIFLLVLFYLWKSFQLLAQHQKNIEAVYSDITNRDLSWLRFLMIGLLVIWVIGVGSSFILNEWLQIEIPMYGALYTNISAAIFAIGLGFFGLQQKIVFNQNTPSPSALIQEATTGSNFQGASAKYLKTGLDAQSADERYQELLQLMENEEPQLDPDLTLYKLSSYLTISPNQLSQVINSNAKMNFFDFVNRYRVHSFIEKMKDENQSKKTFLAMAFDSGFNSKSAFNRAFKKVTGETPSAYKKRIT